MHFTLHTPSAEHLIPALFLERDDTIYVEKKYLYRKEDLDWIPGADDSIIQLNKASFRVMVVSNQAGIACGLYTAQKVNDLHKHVSTDLMCKGRKIDAHYFCSHHHEYGENRSCECCKPRPLMILEAAMSLNIDIVKSWIPRDKAIDIQAGQLAGVSTIIVRSCYWEGEFENASVSKFVVEALCDAIENVISLESAQDLLQ
jgi:D-glycero-D-manno-heptose 1,7-bisphosphate phosphatase